MTSLDTSMMAGEIGTDSRTFRKFLRSDASPYEPVGQGSRYVFDESDIADLKKLFGEWGKSRRGPKAPGSSAQKISPSGAKKVRKSRGVEKDDPLAGDDLLLRTTMSIADRQRRQGIICNYQTSHPKVRGLEVKCNHQAEGKTGRCKKHQQLKWCGDWEPVHELCGPGHYCGYHNGDISDEEFEALRVGAEIDRELED